MDIAALLATRGHLLVAAPGRRELVQLADLARQSDSHIGVAGRDLPLLDALTVGENIALPAMYHHGLTPEQVIRRLEGPARALGLDGAMDLRPANLAKRDVMRAKMLRCLARGCGVLLLMQPAPADVGASLEALEADGGGVRLWAACLGKDAADYAPFDLNPVSLRTAQ